MSTPLILTVEGHRAPPSEFVKRLERFDPSLRVVWGLGLGVPFPGWVVERRIPDAMKAKVYGGKTRPADQKRYADQIITDHFGGAIGRRQYDMMPDWHPIYRVMDAEGNPVTELGEHVIDYLRRNYERTLLGFPELSAKHHAADLAEKAARDAAKEDARLDRSARMVMDRKTEIFPESFAFSRQPAQVKEGTELYGEIRSDDGSDQGSTRENSESLTTH